MENEKPSKATLEWVAYSLCQMYPGLQDVDPRVTAKKVDPNFKMNEKTKFISWVCIYHNIALIFYLLHYMLLKCFPYQLVEVQAVKILFS